MAGRRRATTGCGPALASASGRAGMKARRHFPNKMRRSELQDDNRPPRAGQFVRRSGRPRCAYHPLRRLRAATPSAGTPISTSEFRLCADAIAKMGTSDDLAAEQLAKWLGHSNRWFRILAAESLKEMGPAAAPAIPALISTLENEDSELVVHSVAALGRTGPAAKAAVFPLVGLLESPREAATAIRALGHIGPDARAAEPFLQEILDEGPPERRVETAAALCRIGSQSNRQLIELLRAHVREGDDRVRLLAAKQLVDLEAGTEEIVTELLDMLHQDPKTHSDTVDPTPFNTTSRLDNVHDFRAELVRVLSIIRPVSPQVVEALSDVVRNDVLLVARSAIEGLGEMGPAAKQAIPVLEQALFDAALSDVARNAIVKIESVTTGRAQ